MPAHDSKRIANRLLELAAEHGKTLTPLQLIKLTYLCHGWMLGLYGLPLVRERVEAWAYGPVYPNLYHAIKRYESEPVSDRLDVIDTALSDLEVDLIGQVFNVYGRMTGIHLSKLTHQSDTPWSETWQRYGRNTTISNDLIEEHFRMLYQRSQQEEGATAE